MYVIIMYKHIGKYESSFNAKINKIDIEMSFILLCRLAITPHFLMTGESNFKINIECFFVL
jgi:hypothetical protein